jgi:pimeloyl-ACP methyl ester carboxylesterase
MIPGLFASPRLFADQLAHLGQRGAVMVAGPMRDKTMHEIAREILAAAPPRFMLVGLSMGGYVCLEMLRQSPERVAKLALLATSARPDTPEQTMQRKEQIAAAREGRFAELPDAAFPHLVHPAHRDDAGLQRLVRRMAEESGPEAFIHQQTATMNRPDSRPDLADIRCPTLVLAGDADEIIPDAHSRELADTIADSRLTIVPECGHICAVEQPEVVTRALVELWRRDF